MGRRAEEQPMKWDNSDATKQAYREGLIRGYELAFDEKVAPRKANGMLQFKSGYRKGWSQGKVVDRATAVVDAYLKRTRKQEEEEGMILS
jgi:hypothetical protein